MEINITLFFQVVQFACAYCFLYKFLFTPACKILDENEQIKKELYENLERNQHVKDILLEDYRVKCSAFKKVLIETVPAESTQSMYQKSMFGSTLYCIEEVHFSEQDKNKTESFLVDHLSRVIKK
jgi:hypothetical protein